MDGLALGEHVRLQPASCLLGSEPLQGSRSGGGVVGWEEGRKGGREEGRKGGREEGRKGGREEGGANPKISLCIPSAHM